MYKVEYRYYNYPSKVRNFESYEKANKFFYYIAKKNGVKSTELTKV